jgi:hypothetical protein
MIETALEAKMEQHRIQEAKEREETTARVIDEVTTWVTAQVST